MVERKVYLGGGLMGDLIGFQGVVNEIHHELQTSASKCGDEFDDKNTSNDWVAYVVMHVGKAVTLPFDKGKFEEQMMKVAGLAISAIMTSRRNNGPSPRHYDHDYRQTEKEN